MGLCTRARTLNHLPTHARNAWKHALMQADSKGQQDVDVEAPILASSARLVGEENVKHWMGVIGTVEPWAGALFASLSFLRQLHCFVVSAHAPQLLQRLK